MTGSKSRTYTLDLKNGISLFVEDFYHETVPLLVIHGGPSWSHDYLNPGLRLIASEWRVVAPDLRGCGKSTGELLIEAYQPEAVVEDLAELLDRLQLDRVNLLGFSTGGQHAQLFVAAHGERVENLVLASTTAFGAFDKPFEAWETYRERKEIPAKVTCAETEAEQTRAWAINDAPFAIWDLSRMDEYLALLDQTIFTGDWNPPYRQKRLHPFRPPDPIATLRAFRRPILILHGRQDMCFPVEVAQRLHGALPDSALRILESCGHQAAFEKPREWARAVCDFLAENSECGR